MDASFLQRKILVNVRQRFPAVRLKIPQRMVKIKEEMLVLHPVKIRS
jgi:hypothetical protein